MLEEQNKTREPDLVPVRHGRMMVSPFTFYRGAAKIMAADLSETPTAGLDVQLCGDAHLSNFGVYASPERTLVFDLNDFDETLPGPFEYDVKRLAASFTIAARNNAYSKADARAVTLASVNAYRIAMIEFAAMPHDGDLVRPHVGAGRHARDRHRRAFASSGRARRRSRRTPRGRTEDRREGALARQPAGALEARRAGRRRVPNRQPAADRRAVAGGRRALGVPADQIEHLIHEQFRAYRETLQDDRRHLLERFEFVDVARKVVGVGSVGTGAYIVLLQGRDQQDPLFLQVKEATTSVLEDHLPKSRYAHAGERVVQGQRLMQAASDIFLGWTKGVRENRYLYWRQLRDMKGSAVVEGMVPEALEFYARLCGRTLARAHARSGDPIAIAAYLGKKDRFDQSITDFAERYADQNERDYRAFTDAISSGRLPALEGV